MSPRRKPHEAESDPWVVSQEYEGPNRRHRAAWFAKKHRLDDVHAEVEADAESTETLLRRVSVWGGLANAARDQRAVFLATLEALAAKGKRDRHPMWPEVVAACARYVRSVGAEGKIDEPLLNDALRAAQRANVEQAQARPETELIERLERAAHGQR